MPTGRSKATNLIIRLPAGTQIEGSLYQRFAGFRSCADAQLVRGFAVGRTIFAQTARAWLSGEISDDRAVQDMAQRFDTLCTVWLQCRSKTTG